LVAAPTIVTEKIEMIPGTHWGSADESITQYQPTEKQQGGIHLPHAVFYSKDI
jgi:hypothetical protein